MRIDNTRIRGTFPGSLQRGTSIRKVDLLGIYTTFFRPLSIMTSQPEAKTLLLKARRKASTSNRTTKGFLRMQRLTIAIFYRILYRYRSNASRRESMKWTISLINEPRYVCELGPRKLTFKAVCVPVTAWQNLRSLSLPFHSGRT